MYPSCTYFMLRLLSFTGFEFREDETLSFLKCQTCNQTKCKLKSCNDEIMNRVFCANQHQHIITEQTRSPSSSSLETHTSLNEPTTSEQEIISEQHSASMTVPRIGKCLCVVLVD